MKAKNKIIKTFILLSTLMIFSTARAEDSGPSCENADKVLVASAAKIQELYVDWKNSTDVAEKEVLSAEARGLQRLIEAVLSWKEANGCPVEISK